MFFVVFCAIAIVLNAQESSFPVVPVGEPAFVNQEFLAPLPLPKSAQHCTLSAGEVPFGLLLNNCHLAGIPNRIGSYEFTIRFKEARKASATLATFVVKVREKESRIEPVLVYFIEAEMPWTVRQGVLRRNQVTRIDSAEGPISAQTDWGYYNDPTHPVTKNQVCFDEIAGTRLFINGEQVLGGMCVVAGITAYVRIPAELEGKTASLQLVGTDAFGQRMPTNILFLPVE